MKDDVIFKHVHVTVTPEKVETYFIFHKEDKKWWKFFTTFFFAGNMLTCTGLAGVR